jgi:hypothetical protein
LKGKRCKTISQIRSQVCVGNKKRNNIIISAILFPDSAVAFCFQADAFSLREATRSLREDVFYFGKSVFRLGGTIKKPDCCFS